MMLVAKSLLLFLLAGLCEIGGGYLVWQWWRAGVWSASHRIGTISSAGSFA